MGKKDVLGTSDEFPNVILLRDVSYEGILLVPYDLPAPSRDLQKGKKRLAAYQHEMGLRIAALFQHYLVPLGDWHTLALKLAVSHVDGFKEKGVRDTQRGRSTLLAKFPKLFDDVKREIAMGLKVDAACEKVARMPRYVSLTAPSIKRRYYEFKKLYGPKKVRK